ncbi:unnamed protein product [Absidia cylindrospora]
MMASILTGNIPTKSIRHRKPSCFCPTLTSQAGQGLPYRTQDDYSSSSGQGIQRTQSTTFYTTQQSMRSGSRRVFCDGLRSPHNWDTTTRANAPLAGDGITATNAIHAWASAGIPEQQLVLGVPFYGYVTRTDPKARITTSMQIPLVRNAPQFQVIKSTRPKRIPALSPTKVFTLVNTNGDRFDGMVFLKTKVVGTLSGTKPLVRLIR